MVVHLAVRPKLKLGGALSAWPGTGRACAARPAGPRAWRRNGRTRKKLNAQKSMKIADMEVSFIASHPDDRDVHDRLLAGPLQRGAAHAETNGLAHSRLVLLLALQCIGRGVARLIEEILTILLDRDALDR